MASEETKSEETDEEKQTDEEKLYSEKTIKVETMGSGFMLADYSGTKGPAAFCGVSMVWKSDPIINDPFTTKEDAVKAAWKEVSSCLKRGVLKTDDVEHKVISVAPSLRLPKKFIGRFKKGWK